MSQENVEIVRSIYEAFNRRDWDAAFRDQRPDVEMTTPPGPNAGTFRGQEEIQGYWEEMLTPFEAWTAEPEEFFEHGDQVVALIKNRLRPKGTDAELEMRAGAIWTIRDGAVVSMRIFPQPEKALKAAGLSE